MSTPTTTPPQREALDDLDRAYREFLAMFGQVPDEALLYLPPGDEYRLGVLPAHLQDPLRDYLALLERLLRADFAPIDLSADPALAEAKAQRHARLVAMRPTRAGRARILAELEAAHQAARARLAELDAATFEREAPVIYAPGAAPYPTSGRAITGWLIDHYREHITQTRDLLAAWRATTSDG